MLVWILFMWAMIAPDPTIYAGPIRGITIPPAKVVVKVTEYLMVDGKKIGIQEWSDRPQK